MTWVRKQTDEENYIVCIKERDGQTERQKETETESETERQRDRHRDRDRKPDTRTQKSQINRQTGKHVL